MAKRYVGIVLFFTSLLGSVPALAHPVLRVFAAGESLEIHDYGYALPAPERYAVALSLKGADAQHLQQLLYRLRGKHAVIAIGAHEIVLPLVRAIPANGQIELTLGDALTYNDVARELER